MIMFEPGASARIYGLEPGVDFTSELVAGLRARMAGQPPEAMAKARLIVNTRRMARRVRDIFDAGPACFVPRIGVVTALDDLWEFADLPEVMPGLQRKLELSQLISALLTSQPDLAPRSAVFALTDGLVALMDEMQGEGVPFDALAELDISDQSGHWARIKSFLSIIKGFEGRADLSGQEARNRHLVEELTRRWTTAPPADPVILAGTTGSRGTTHLLARAISQLPQGAVILPGYDRDMPDSAWEALDKSANGEDHPQYRFRVLQNALDLGARDVQSWTQARPASPARNAVLSLALRPAPVTDQWREDGPQLTGIKEAMHRVTLLEAPSQRIEALCIAMRLRQAAETGESAALITPDRGLTRRVAAALDRWRIVPDDSAGEPLDFSAPGRFLRHVAELFAAPLASDLLLTLLKHPLTHAGAERGEHLLLTRELELHLRKERIPFPTRDDITNWAARQTGPMAAGWANWLCDAVMDRRSEGAQPIAVLARAHHDLALVISRGCTGAESEPLWAGDAGISAKSAVDDLLDNAAHGGDISALDFANLLRNILSAGQVRSAARAHPLIRIWGTLEARVQGADLVILAGLNEGTWPESAAHDPWLNRALRKQVGLLLPERRIGLAAHDFQQAALAPEVWFSRSVRSDEAETVSCRWLNRLTNLLEGLPAQGGVKALEQMRERGAAWLSMADMLEDCAPVTPASRPAPCPPKSARPSRLSVTRIKQLIRDPYAIYCRYVLRLNALDPILPMPDALLRGIAIHEVLEHFVRDATASGDITRDQLLTVADGVFEQMVPWPQMRILWRARLERVVDWFITEELGRQTLAKPAGFEVRGRRDISELGFTLSANADRIDVDRQGRLLIYDYKTGAPPTKPVQENFDKQLLLEAAIAEHGGFENVPLGPVERALFIGLASGGKTVDAPLDDHPPVKVWQEFHALISAYQDADKGYVSRRALQRENDPGDYDHLARFGEWDATDDALPILLEPRDG